MSAACAGGTSIATQWPPGWREPVVQVVEVACGMSMRNGSIPATLVAI
jgi:hypothetical protein